MVWKTLGICCYAFYGWKWVSCHLHLWSLHSGQLKLQFVDLRLIIYYIVLPSLSYLSCFFNVLVKFVPVLLCNDFTPAHLKVMVLYITDVCRILKCTLKAFSILRQYRQLCTFLITLSTWAFQISLISQQ